MNQAPKTKTRNVTTTAMRRDNFINELPALGLTTAHLQAVTNLAQKHFTTTGNTSTSETNPSITKDDIEYFYCSRTEIYFPAHLMTMSKEGVSRGYSKMSQDILTTINRDIANSEKLAVSEMIAGNIEVAMEHANKTKELHKIKADGTMYTDHDTVKAIEVDSDNCIINYPPAKEDATSPAKEDATNETPKAPTKTKAVKEDTPDI